MMYLSQRPSRGHINVFGKNINFADRDELALFRRKIGVVFQDFRLIDNISAFDNVALPLRVCGMPEREIRKRVTELLQWVELDNHMLSRPATLSGGEKQRIAIARAVINRPELLLADEPTGNVDNFIAPKLMKLFVELNKIGTTVVIATHSEKLITDFAYPRLHLRDKNLRIYYPHDTTGLRS
jgi:cell division transport system ATP-binding protein